jgi:hypothetical protein
MILKDLGRKRDLLSSESDTEIGSVESLTNEQRQRGIVTALSVLLEIRGRNTVICRKKTAVIR